jgi:hypothetical protein
MKDGRSVIIGLSPSEPLIMKLYSAHRSLLGIAPPFTEKVAFVVLLPEAI